MNVIGVAINAKNGTTQVDKKAVTSMLKAAAKSRFKSYRDQHERDNKCNLQNALENPATIAIDAAEEATVENANVAIADPHLIAKTK